MIELTNKQKKILRLWATGNYRTTWDDRNRAHYDEDRDDYYYNGLNPKQKGNLIDYMPCEVWDKLTRWDDWDCQSIELYLDKLAKKMRGGE